MLGYGFFYALALLLMPEGEGFTLWFYVLLAIAVAWVVLIFHAFDSTVERVDCCLVCEKMRKSS
ncbi:MAG: hypothetical protein F7C35_08250 [Desulfurococcales archaeon]|nr:hypothetical protein [Desulfurococcales archaeon]